MKNIVAESEPAMLVELLNEHLLEEDTKLFVQDFSALFTATILETFPRFSLNALENLAAALAEANGHIVYCEALYKAAMKDNLPILSPENVEPFFRVLINKSAQLRDKQIKTTSQLYRFVSILIHKIPPDDIKERALHGLLTLGADPSTLFPVERYNLDGSF